MTTLRYRFDMIGAHYAGENAHPQLVILRYAPDAFDFEPVSISDCWLFRTKQPIEPLPSFIQEVVS